MDDEDEETNEYITSHRRPKVFCNDCLFEFAKDIGKILKTDQIKLKIFADDETYNCKVYVFEEE